MVATIQTAGVYGIEGYPVLAECDLSRGLPRLDIVGLPDTAVKESGDRVRAAMKNCEFEFPLSRVTINLAPADVRKEGPIYDLPILLGILMAGRQIKAIPKDYAFLGEVSLGGELRKVEGVLSMAIALRKAGIKKLFVPAPNGEEAALAGAEIAVYEASHLNHVLKHLSGEEQLAQCVAMPYVEQWEDTLDFAHVMGQQNAKRAIEVAVAGGHNILMCGSPGSGKSMMAKRIASILPPMSEQERLEIIRIHSISGKGREMVKRAKRPFVSLHHTATAASLTGGGSANRLPRPGEISRAHHGILFLDELPEFKKDSLEVLRQPMEDGTVTISRVYGKVTYPSQFMLVCAMNPCPCGWYGHASGRCTCKPDKVKRYVGKLSGPLLDRIDIQIEVHPVEYEALQNRTRAESSEEIRKRVLRAREVQTKRFAGTNITCNAYIDPSMMSEVCVVSKSAEKLLEAAFSKLGLTARAYDRMLRVGRTIADLAGSEIIEAAHMAESIQYRNMERRL